MKSKSLFFASLFFAIHMFSQTEPADLIFKDGDTIPGYGMITKNNKIKFKLSLEEPADVYEGILVKEVIFYGDKEFKSFEFVKTGVKRSPILMEVICEGKANLYELKDNYEDMFAKETANNIENSANSRHIYVDEVQKAWFLKRKDEPVGLRIGKSFKQTAESYFRDCNTIKELFESRDYLNYTKLQIVEEYNLLCID